MKISLHIYQSDMTRESRIFKTAKTLWGSFDSIYLAGLGGADLPRKESLSEKTIILRSPSLGNKGITFLAYYFWISGLLLKIRPNVLTIHSLELLPLLTIAKLLGIKVVYDAHELETEKNGMTGVRKKVSKIVERFFIRFCDRVSVVGYEIANYYKALYPNLPKPEVVLNIPNEVKENDFYHNIFRELFSIDNDDIIFLYQGLLGKGRGIEIILEAFKGLRDKSKKVVFMGYGQLEDVIRKAVSENDNIFFKEAVSPQVVLEYTASADIGLSLIENTSLSYFYCLPNKLFEYSQVEIPVIVSNNIEMKNIVEQYRIGYVLKKNDPGSLLEVIENVNRDELATFKANVTSFKKKYHWQMQEDKIRKMYKF